jgi:glycosyltransferase involved in cell wall biosynthesis
MISGSLPPMKCGVGDYTASLARALARREGISVAVVTDVAATPIHSELEYEVFPIAHAWKMSDIFPIGTIARSWHPDIMHIQYPTQGYGQSVLPWFLPGLFRLANVPVVQTWHEYHPHWMGKRNLLNAMLGGGLVVVRPHYEATMPPWYRWFARRKHVRFIPNASAIPKAQSNDATRSAVRSGIASSPAKLVAFFGFAYPPKGVELLFDIADPMQDHIVLMCDLSLADSYHNSIFACINRPCWAGRVTKTGFVSATEAAAILDAADAVVFPFREGAGLWNTSIHAARVQGTFVLTTSRERHGYDSREHVYYAKPDDIFDMKRALRTYIGQKKSTAVPDPESDWDFIAHAHISIFNDVLGKSASQ